MNKESVIHENAFINTRTLNPDKVKTCAISKSLRKGLNQKFVTITDIARSNIICHSFKWEASV